MKKLNRLFFNNPTLVVAKELLGKQIIFYNKRGIITETEAYIGQDDPACHATKGLTKRTRVMFGDAGYSYIYLIYGMYHCLNFVTEKNGFPAAVLIRGILSADSHLDGPGKLCRYLGITKEHNQIDITLNDNFYLTHSNIKFQFNITPRIGISQGKEKLWRFVANISKQAQTVNF